MSTSELQPPEHQRSTTEQPTRRAQKLISTLDHDGPATLSVAASSVHPADVATALEHMSTEQRRRVVLALEPMIASEVLEELTPELRDELLDDTSDQRLVSILNQASTDDSIYLLDHLDHSRAQRLLQQIEEQLRGQLEEQYELPEDSAGRLMTRDVVTMRPFMTAQQVFNTLRQREHAYEGVIFVIDAQNHLLGVLPLRVLARADLSQPVEHIMDRNVRAVSLATDQEEVVDLMQRYHMRAVPVIDQTGHLCGQITWDDAVDVLEAEAEADMLALAGTNEELEENLGIWGRARERLPYLLLTAVGGFIMAKMIHSNTDSALGNFPILLAFLPMVPALGGNIGIQCSTITVRSIATGELRPGRMWSRSVREIGTGMLLALILSVVCGLGATAMISYSEGDSFLGIIITVSLLLAIVIAAVFGVAIPLACQKFNIDPAIAAGPFITMLNDITGVGIYIATSVLLLQASS